MNKVKSFKDRWEWIVTYMILVDKFVAHVLMMMDKIDTEEVGFMAVAVQPLRIALFYNSKNLEELKDSEICYILTHEVYHVVLHHCTTRRSNRIEDQDLHNIAHDLAVNTLIQEDGKYRTKPRTKDGEIIGAYPDKFNFPEKLSYEQYVQLLEEKRKEEEEEKKNNDQDNSGDDSFSGFGFGMKPDKQEDPEDNSGSGEGEKSNKQSNSDGDSDGDSDDKSNMAMDSHDLWKEEDIVDEMIRNKVNQIMSNGKVWGSLPGDLQAIIAAAQETKVSWERYLKYHLGNLISPTYTRTITKPDKRFGYPYLGKKRGYSDRKLVAIDTSGSISNENLAQFLAEVNKLVEIMPVDLLLFDTDIQLGPIPFDKKHISFDFKGRGGTDFAPAFKLAEEKRYQSVIILTDGYAPAIEYPHGVKDVLWVLTEKQDPPVEWGVRIHIEG